MKRQEKMLKKGGGHVGVGIEPGHRPATLHGTLPRASSGRGGRGGPSFSSKRVLLS